jgi:hypothetical protein
MDKVTGLGITAHQVWSVKAEVKIMFSIKLRRIGAENCIMHFMIITG